MISKQNEELTPVNYDNTAIKFLRFTPTKHCHCFNLHWHRRIEIIKIKSGSMEINIGGKTFTAYENDIAICFPCTPHEARTYDSEAVYDVIMFEPTILKNDTPAYKQFIEPLVLNDVAFYELINDDEIKKIIDDLITVNSNEKLKTSNISALYMFGDIFKLFGKFYEKYGNSIKKVNRSKSTFEEVIKYINDNFTENITTQSISERFGFNESYFSRRFKDLTGINSAKYIRILRLEYAKKLLSETNLPINKIAVDSGFSDIIYFNRCFKEYYGVPPTKFNKHS